MEDIKVFFAKQLKKLRIAKGLSQEQLALLAGLNRTYISKIEKAKRNITLETVQKLASALGIHYREFFNCDVDFEEGS
ncbi:MAG TPA: XRE family transcriptional regulator [Candidatus Aenigmarchaeota archaeon]|nr:XRE family transcriptional regulator [Candidatus Aenigmarchaeota archaeon]